MKDKNENHKTKILDILIITKQGYCFNKKVRSVSKFPKQNNFKLNLNLNLK